MAYGAAAGTGDNAEAGGAEERSGHWDIATRTAAGRVGAFAGCGFADFARGPGNDGLVGSTRRIAAVQACHRLGANLAFENFTQATMIAGIRVTRAAA